MPPRFEINSNEMEETIWPVVGAVVDESEAKAGFNLQVPAEQIEEGYYIHVKLKPGANIDPVSTAATVTETETDNTENEGATQSLAMVSDEEKPLGIVYYCIKVNNPIYYRQ